MQLREGGNKGGRVGESESGREGERERGRKGEKEEIGDRGKQAYLTL
jgi:hypothetical protein